MVTRLRAKSPGNVTIGAPTENALKVVLPNGELISTASRARKSAAGYDLTRLFVGAEGTLGVITELTLRLHGIPQAIAAGVCQFPSVHAACDAAILAIQSGIPIARVELLDDVMIRGCNAYSKLRLVETPTLFVEFHGSNASVVEQSELFGQIAAETGSLGFESATKPEERSRLWQARHDSFWAIQALRPGARILVTDVCVPISRLAECVSETKADLDKSGLIAPIVGHAGDGNFHAGVLVMMDDLDEVARAKAFADRLAERAISMDGTCTGEHAIGQGKKRFLDIEHGSSAVTAMRAIKSALDPGGMMNPEKIF